MEVLSGRILVRPSDLGRGSRFYRDVLSQAIYVGEDVSWLRINLARVNVG